MPYLNKKQIDWFKKRLTQMLQECEESINALKENDELPSRGGDEADMATATIHSATQANLSTRLEAKRREILAALSRIEEGTFGYCEDTGEEIGLERLKANPLARLSIEAQQRREHTSKYVRRGAVG